jgi:hypothetical protein
MSFPQMLDSICRSGSYGCRERGPAKMTIGFASDGGVTLGLRTVGEADKNPFSLIARL